MRSRLNVDKIVQGIWNIAGPEWYGWPDPGICVLRGMLGTAECEALTAELEAGTFLPAGDVGGIRQEFEAFALRPPCTGFPLTEALGYELRSCAAFNPLTKNWRPNDISAQRYLPSHSGIDPHRDFRRDICLVAVFTLTGLAHFRWHEQMNSTKSAAIWTVGPGDLVLMRGPGFREVDFDNQPITGDDRPIHSISRPLGDTPRLSLAYRMNTDYLTP